MAWITPAALAVTAIAGAASAAASAGRSPAQSQQNEGLQRAGLQNAINNQANQSLVQALINQRSVAGQTDAFGSGVKYDPATNTWQSTLGKLPMASQTAAQQAAISRNTTDLRGAQFANQEAARRATRAEPAADAARMQFENFRPMGADALTGLLQQQATNAQQATFRPLVADTLRQYARTGTAAGPVLGQIGRDEAKNLRDSLIDAQIKGMTGASDINTQRKQALGNAATTAAGLASPSLGYSALSGSGVDNTMNQVVSQRAAQAGVAPAQGMFGANAATEATNKAYGTLGANLSDPNFGLNAISGALKDTSTLTGQGGSIKALVDYLSKQNSDNYSGPSSSSLLGGAGSPDYLQGALGLGSNQYVP